jgi:uncharacterized protein YlxW (UPF0749 family)
MSDVPDTAAGAPEEPPESGSGHADSPRTKPTRHLRAGALIGVLVALLGFAVAVQVHSNSGADRLSGLRDTDLISILDDQNSRAAKLREQIAQLQATEQQLQASGNRDSVAQQQAQQQVQALGILLGTIPAMGPGVSVNISDPSHKVKAEDLLDVVEELRGAGAEAIQFGSVRVSTSTSFSDASDGSITVDGASLRAPYTVLAIGDGQTLQTALEIPGGVAATIRADGGNAVIAQQAKVEITALRATQEPKYAKPTGR